MTGTDAGTGGAAPTTITLPFSPTSAKVARQRLCQWLVSLTSNQERLEDCRLVLSELVGNAVRHARPLEDGTVKVAWMPDDGGVEIAVTDGGAVGDPHKVDAPQSAVSGRGLAVVEALAHRWWVDDERGGTTVHAFLML
jgi:anti-sigma regulatory factor (Ser/Thr protein kinase)